MIIQGLSNFHNSQAFIGGFSTSAQTSIYTFFSGGIATFFRMFYLLTILTIGLCINFKDPTLLSAALGLKDLAYQQPLFPLLPLGIVILVFLMFIAQGYAAVKGIPSRQGFVQLYSYCDYLNIFKIQCRISLQHTLAWPSPSFYISDTPFGNGFIQESGNT